MLVWKPILWGPTAARIAWLLLPPIDHSADGVLLSHNVDHIVA